MMRWLEQLKQGKTIKFERGQYFELKDGRWIKCPRKYSAYTQRIQKKIDRELENGLWLAINRPDLFKDERTEFQDQTLERYRRLKKLMLIIKALYPTKDVQLILKQESLFDKKPQDGAL